MKPWIALLLLVSLAMPGCALMEDLGFGPESYDNYPGRDNYPGQGNSCGAPVVVNTVQTQEPELLNTRR